MSQFYKNTYAFTENRAGIFEWVRTSWTRRQTIFSVPHVTLPPWSFGAGALLNYCQRCLMFLRLEEGKRIHLFEGCIVGCIVVFDGNLGSHTTHGVDSSLVAGLDQQLAVGQHAWLCHGHDTSAQKNYLLYPLKKKDAALTSWKQLSQTRSSAHQWEKLLNRSQCNVVKLLV